MESSKKRRIPAHTDPHADLKLFKLMRGALRDMGLQQRPDKKGFVTIADVVPLPGIPNVPLIVYPRSGRTEMYWQQRVTTYVFHVTVMYPTKPLLKGREENNQVPWAAFLFLSNGTVLHVTAKKEVLSLAQAPFYPNWEAGISAVLMDIKEEIGNVSSAARRAFTRAYYANPYRSARPQKPRRGKSASDARPI